MTVRDVDTIVHSTKIGCSSDEVNVMVAVVVLLEFNGVEAVPSK